MGDASTKIVGMLPTIVAVGIMDKTVKMVKKW